MIRVIVFLSLLVMSCSSLHPSQAGSEPVDHSLFTQLLRKYVDEKGKVNYSSLKKDEDKLNQYLQLLSANAPDEDTWTREEQLAYWINAYNAFTLRLILDHYPLESIKDIGSAIQIPFVNTPWDIKFIKIGTEKYDLNNIEHSILRKNFDEPRIHFAIVCASYSCPQLRREAYEADRLEEQLSAQARLFLADTTKNKFSKDKAEVSKIFSWFKGDFTKDGTLVDFLNRYAPVTLSSEADVSYRDYDWSLNEQ